MILYDYGGPIFVHKHAKLTQRHITDTSGSLVPPWKEYEKLRTGTVVLIKVALRVYCAVPAGNRIWKVCFPKIYLPPYHF